MKNLFSLISILFLLWSCSDKPDGKSYTYYLGTYTDGESEGIYQGALRADGTFDTLRLAASMVNPSYLTWANGRQTLLAVSEVDDEGTGIIHSYQRQDDGLKVLNTAATGGAHPCHIAVGSAGDVLLANYSGGNVGYVTVDAAGQLSPLLDVAQHRSDDSDVSSHAHSTWFLDAKNVVALDLGLDQLIFYELKDQAMHRMDSLSLASGSGPRHLAIHPNGKLLYVVNELNSTVSVVSREGQGWQVMATLSTLPNDFTGKSYCADIHLSPDARFLYASNRGHNSIGIFSISDSGKELQAIAYEPVRGDWPRNFALTPDGALLVVANQRSHNLAAFQRDAQSGLLQYMSEIKADSPACVLFH
ncbi:MULTISPECIES: lactonase family protein [unclassified Carboxylicivirga]|uniref:lactonase family protein n=1 Tax=Carboxylicivirga TaxID=1628153 RepID=UPI003D34A292